MSIDKLLGKMQKCLKAEDFEEAYDLCCELAEEIAEVGELELEDHDEEGESLLDS